MKHIFISFLFLVLTTTYCHSNSKARELLPILGDFKAAPKNWLDPNKQAQGIMIDLLNGVSARTSIDFTFKLYPWKRAFALSEIGRGAIIGFSKTSQREKKWDYSEPMFIDELVLVTTKVKSFNFTNLQSLDGRRLAIKSGASYGDDFEDARKKGYFKVVETTDRTGQMRMLTANRVDLVLVSPGRIALETVIARNDWLSDHREDFVILDPPYKSDPNFLGIPKSMNKSHLLPIINDALSAIKADGTYEKIIDKNIEKALNAIQ